MKLQNFVLILSISILVAFSTSGITAQPLSGFQTAQQNIDMYFVASGKQVDYTNFKVSIRVCVRGSNSFSEVSPESAFPISIEFRNGANKVVGTVNNIIASNNDPTLQKKLGALKNNNCITFTHPISKDDITGRNINVLLDNNNIVPADKKNNNMLYCTGRFCKVKALAIEQTQISQQPQGGGSGGQITGPQIISSSTVESKTITTFAGNPKQHSKLPNTWLGGFSGDKDSAIKAELNTPAGIVSDSGGNIYVADSKNNRVRKIDLSGLIKTIAGTGAAGFSGDGKLATLATLNIPSDVALDSSNNIYIADSGNKRIRKIDAKTGIITTVAGNGAEKSTSGAISRDGSKGDGYQAISANLGMPLNIEINSRGDIYAVVPDYNIYTSTISGDKAQGPFTVIRKINPVNGIIYTLCNGEKSKSGTVCGGEAYNAYPSPSVIKLNSNTPYITMDKSDNLFVRYVYIDAVQRKTLNAILAIDNDGKQFCNFRLYSDSTLSGTSCTPKESIYLVFPESQVKKYDKKGKIITIAGTGTAGFSGDGGQGASAQLNNPQGLTVDTLGNLYISDTYNQRIRKVAYAECNDYALNKENSGVSVKAVDLYNPKYKVSCDFGDKKIQDCMGVSGPEGCTFEKFDGTKAVFDCSETKVKTVDVYCNLNGGTKSMCCSTPPEKVGTVVVNEPKNNAECIGIDMPKITISAGQNFGVDVTMKNTGNTIWSPTGYYLSSKNNPEILWGSIKLNSPANVMPKTNQKFTAPVTAPQTAGPHQLILGMKEGSDAFGQDCSKQIDVLPQKPESLQAVCSDQGDKATLSWSKALGAENYKITALEDGKDGYLFTGTVSENKKDQAIQCGKKNFLKVVSSAKTLDSESSQLEFSCACPKNDAECSEINVPKEVKIGESFPITIKMKNIGTKVWKDATHELSLKPGNHNWQTHSSLPAGSTYKKGDTATFQFDSSVPTALGTYTYAWSMKEGTEYFGKECTANVEVLPKSPSNPKYFCSQSGNEVTFSWDSVKAAKSYSVKIDTLTSTSLKNTFTQEVDCDKPHKWSVKYTSSIGLESDELSGVEFTCPCKNDAECSEISAPKQVKVEEKFDVNFKIKNTGTKTWSDVTHEMASKHKGDFDYQSSSMSSKLVKKGDLATFYLTPSAPIKTGTYGYVWGMKEGAEYFGNQCTANIDVLPKSPSNFKTACNDRGDEITLSWDKVDAANTYIVKVDDSSTPVVETDITTGLSYKKKINCGKKYLWGVKYAAQSITGDEVSLESSCPCKSDATCESIQAPSEVKIGGSFDIKVKMKNTGTKTWAKTTHSLRTLPLLENRMDTQMASAQVVPDETTEFPFTITASRTTEGTYNIKADMTENGISFGKTCETKIKVFKPCSNYNFDPLKSKVEPSSILTGEKFSIYCDYGQKDLACIKPVNRLLNNDCLFKEWVGTSARFECSGTRNPVSIDAFCKLEAGTSSNCCASSPEKAGTVVVKEPQDDAKCESVEAPDTVIEGETFPITVKVTNTGNTKWTLPDYALVSDDDENGFPDLHKPQTTILPGQLAVFTFTSARSVLGTKTVGGFYMTNSRNAFATGGCTKQITVKSKPKNDAECYSINTYNEVLTGQEFLLGVTMKNTGTTVWNNQKYRLVQLSGGLTPEKIDITSENQNLFGFQANVKAPYKAGNYNIKWTMTEDGVGNFGASCEKQIVVKEPKDDAQCLEFNVPLAVESGEFVKVTGKIKNTGETTWNSDYKLVPSSSPGGIMTGFIINFVPSTVKPGETANFDYTKSIGEFNSDQEIGYGVNMMKNGKAIGMCYKTFTVEPVWKVIINPLGGATVRNKTNPIQTFGNLYGIEISSNVPNSIGGMREAQFNTPTGLDVYYDSQGRPTLYIADTYNHRIRKIDPAGKMTTVAGTGEAGYSGEGLSAVQSKLNSPEDVAVGPDGTVYIADTLNSVIRKIDSGGKLLTIAGQGRNAGDNIPASESKMYKPRSVYFAAREFNSPSPIDFGKLYIIENNRIREIDILSNNIRTIVGTGIAGFSGDGGPATSAQLNNPSGIVKDDEGNLYIADTNNNKIRKLTLDKYSYPKTYTISTLNLKTSGGANVFLSRPSGVDFSQNLYITDSSRVMKFDIKRNTVNIIAGSVDGKQGFSGDGGPATSAQLNEVYDIKNVNEGASGSIYIADTYNFKIRKISKSDGIISTIAGSGKQGYFGDGGQAVGGTYYTKMAVLFNRTMGPMTDQYSKKEDIYLCNGCEGGNYDWPVFVAGWDGLNWVADGITKTVPPNGWSEDVDITHNVFTTDTLYARMNPDGLRGHQLNYTFRFNKEGNTADIFYLNFSVLAKHGDRPEFLRVESADYYPSITKNTWFHPRLKIDFKNKTVWGERSGQVPDFRLGSTSGFAEQKDVRLGRGSDNLDVGTEINDVKMENSFGAVIEKPKANADSDKVVIKMPRVYKITPDKPAVYGNYKIYPVQGSDGSWVRISVKDSTGAGVSEATINKDSSKQLDQQGILLNVIDVKANQDNSVVYGVISIESLSSSSGGGSGSRIVAPIKTIAGSGSGGFSGNGGLATSAQLNNPTGLASDSAGNIYTADTDNNMVRKISTDGTISTVAGTGTLGFKSGTDNALLQRQFVPDYISGMSVLKFADGVDAILAKLNKPKGVAVDADNNIYIADTNNHRIRKVDVVTGKIETIAGNGKAGSVDGLASTSRLNKPSAVAVDSDKNVYIADTYNSRIRKIDSATKRISTIARYITKPEGIAVDSLGNVFVAETTTGRIRKLEKKGQVYIASTLASSLKQPKGVAVDSSGNVFVAEAGGHIIKMIDSATKKIEIIAGTGKSGFSGDGELSTKAEFNGPSGIAIGGASGALYIADTGNHRIRAIGSVEIIPQPVIEEQTDLELKTAKIFGDSKSLYTIVMEVCVKGDKSIYDLKAQNGIVSLQWRYEAIGENGIKFENLGTVSSGNYGIGAIKNGKCEIVSSKILPTAENHIAEYDKTGMLDITINPNNLIPESDKTNNKISIRSTNPLPPISPSPTPQSVQSSSKIITAAGSGSSCANPKSLCGDDGLAKNAQLKNPSGIVLDSSDSIYIADTFDYRVRKVDKLTGIITTIAGTGEFRYTGDGKVSIESGPAKDAIIHPSSIAVDRLGNVFVSDAWPSGQNPKIRKLTPNADKTSYTISAIAGTGEIGYAGDGVNALSAKLSSPVGLLADSSNIYMIDSLRIRKLAPDNLGGYTISTIAGTGSLGSTADSGPALEANMNSNGISIDSIGNIYISESMFNRIRKLTPNADKTSYTISTIAGTGDACPRPNPCGDGGSALQAKLWGPSGISVDTFGNIYFSDSSNMRVRKLSPDGQGGYTISTIIGTGVKGSSGDSGQAGLATIWSPQGIAFDSQNNLYVADAANNKIRMVSASESG